MAIAAIASRTSLAERLRVGLLASHDDAGGGGSEAGGEVTGGGKASRVVSRGGWLRRDGNALNPLNDAGGSLVGGASASILGNEAPGANGLIAAGGASVAGAGIEGSGDADGWGVGACWAVSGGNVVADAAPTLVLPNGGWPTEGGENGERGVFVGGDVIAGAANGEALPNIGASEPVESGPVAAG